MEHGIFHEVPFLLFRRHVAEELVLLPGRRKVRGGAGVVCLPAVGRLPGRIQHRYVQNPDTGTLIRWIAGEFSVILFQHSFIVLISENVLKDYEIIILEYQSIIHMFNHTVHVSSIIP